MKRTFLTFEPLAISLGLFLVLVNVCGGSRPREQKGNLETFTVSPNPICTNLGVPIMRISWSVKGDGRTCLRGVKINDTGVRGDIWGTGVQNGVCGEGDYTRETAFSLSEVFGNNIPSSMTVTANLDNDQSPLAQDNTPPLDTASANTSALECARSATPTP